jgi:Zn ribbon nucleic-acid-binding protein
MKFKTFTTIGVFDEPCTDHWYECVRCGTAFTERELDEEAARVEATAKQYLNAA